MSRTAAPGETAGETAGPGPASIADQADQGWRASWPELVLAGLLVAAVSLAGYAIRRARRPGRRADIHQRPGARPAARHGPAGGGPATRRPGYRD